MKYFICSRQPFTARYGHYDFLVNVNVIWKLCIFVLLDNNLTPGNDINSTLFFPFQISWASFNFTNGTNIKRLFIVMLSINCTFRRSTTGIKVLYARRTVSCGKTRKKRAPVSRQRVPRYLSLSSYKIYFVFRVNTFRRLPLLIVHGWTVVNYVCADFPFFQFFQKQKVADKLKVKWLRQNVVCTSER